MPTRRRFEHATRTPRTSRAARSSAGPGPRPAPRRGAITAGAVVVGLALLAALGPRVGSDGSGAALPSGTVGAGVGTAAPEELDLADQGLGGGASAPVADPAGEDSAPDVTRITSLVGYRWPLPNSRITSAFGYRKGGTFRNEDGVPWHEGIDLSTFCGDHIVAAHDGTVLSAGRRYDTVMGWVGDLGPAFARRDSLGLWGSLAIGIVVDDGNGYRSVYLHLSKVAVKAGQVVKAGDLLGWEGKTGQATGCHLHYSLFRVAETATFGLDPKIVARSLMPDRETARIDPLAALPPPEAGNVIWGWGAIESPPS
jgi:murein DD-endopeptidase MepM/ murein hydrolase activator NlpD